MSKTVAITVLAISLAACVTDVRSRRIPNALTFSAAIAALIYQSASAGWLGAQSSVTGWLVGTALFLPFFLLGGMGAGDVKLLAALGAWLGPSETVHLGMYTLIAGGALGLVVALMRGLFEDGNTQRVEPGAAVVSDRHSSGPEPDARARHRPAPGLRITDFCGNGGDSMAALSAWTRRFRRADDGAELIEMALVTPILLLLIAGMFDFGFLFRSWEVVTNAAREGARVGVLPSYGCADDGPAEERVVSYLTTSGISAPAAGDVVAGNTTITTAAGDLTVCQVNVTVKQSCRRSTLRRDSSEGR